MTGERGAIPEEVVEAMRASGLAHLLAISGLHIGLVTGVLFFAIRASLRHQEMGGVGEGVGRVAGDSAQPP